MSGAHVRGRRPRAPRRRQTTPAPHHARRPAASSTPTRACSSTTTSSDSPDGSTVRTTLGSRLVAVRPTLAEYVLEMPRGAQVIYPKDLGPILILADVFPGAKVLESGVGSGALTLALLRAVGSTGLVTGYEIRDDFATPRAGQRRRLPRRRRAARRRGARHLRRHRDHRRRPRTARPARTVARGEARRAGAAYRRHHARLPPDDRPGRALARGARADRRSG